MNNTERNLLDEITQAMGDYWKKENELLHKIIINGEKRTEEFYKDLMQSRLNRQRKEWTDMINPPDLGP